jgi:hypothetical protein
LQFRIEKEGKKIYNIGKKIDVPIAKWIEEQLKGK